MRFSLWSLEVNVRLRYNFTEELKIPSPECPDMCIKLKI